MAEIDFEGDELVLHLSTLERAESLHGDVRVKAADVQDIAVVDDAMRAVRGLRGSKQFAVVHHNTRGGVRIRLARAAGTGFTELIVGCAEPAAVAARLRAA